ncbi:MAG: HD domain-containing protein [Spirochaetales bacterium]|nr:HD domain-containing protein [Spirochaetales bacterium]
MNLDIVRKIAAENMGSRRSHLDREPGYVLHHGQRTANLTGEIMNRITGGPDVFDPVLYAGALFHDIGKGFAAHNETGAELAAGLLKDVCAPGELDRICHIVRNHCLRKQGLELDDGILAVQDADMIDHFGTQGVWLDFLHRGYKHDTQLATVRLWDSDEFRNHVRDMRELLNFELSKELFDDRIEFQEGFLARLKMESEGRVPDEVQYPGAGKR